MFKEAATYNGFNTSKNGCKEFNKAFQHNSKMVCIAKYDENQWIKIGYTVVNRNGTGGAHPWGKQASQEFQCFAPNEEICTNKTLDFLNRNYKDLTKLPIKPMPTMSFQTNEQNKKNLRCNPILVKPKIIIEKSFLTLNIGKIILNLKYYKHCLIG
jgi:hypothetical protein